ncbi:SAM-dependent methyltransferase [Paenibacillus darwinianus]|uniref:SAM-dependent methyltransferase n=1 Tax=Paenibacillus darwinianus TaxID=1380763 RepID=A0A9W5W8A8_9BACL|nr:class I SAM-dependent methyltransferase [Paenibacillus darwinianus]EXX90777.1 SAM-dependent methyltransferase [Paenibacillus darwinianus]EXX91408.1 SAM-dependent methyltransferase [Paenibacillus darwinianus]EXX92180.1 SAM-dependent methyltransferase [Paenibacillus darwinianus]
MGFLSVLSMAHRMVGERLSPGATAVDATVGNGIDTAFLARTVGPKGTVYGFDIQQAALEATKQRVSSECSSGRMPRLTLWLESHERMKERIPVESHGCVSAVMFNLGYLPGSESAVARSVITRTASTLAALDAALELLQPRGIMTIVAYPGHAGGDEEAGAAAQWAERQPTTLAQTVTYRMAQKKAAPYLIAIEKK